MPKNPLTGQFPLRSTNLRLAYSRWATGYVSIVLSWRGGGCASRPFHSQTRSTRKSRARMVALRGIIAFGAFGVARPDARPLVTRLSEARARVYEHDSKAAVISRLKPSPRVFVRGKRNSAKRLFPYDEKLRVWVPPRSGMRTTWTNKWNDAFVARKQSRHGCSKVAGGNEYRSAVGIGGVDKIGISISGQIQGFPVRNSYCPVLQNVDKSEEIPVNILHNREQFPVQGWRGQGRKSRRRAENREMNL
ncbi:hypothetical protein OE88DRAFT_1640566 [Heliocybe sulcata]|uniref:Uncharacterized protein n=1 Tax=Heliocybe sulcata TaxID=5364 RepID=A0A5C3NH19_9AGAM|nr:hypothetical protein OE88DRAFT_1640566 [Heliocybe sulcata]